MKNWLSKNKYKIIILPVVLLLGIFIGDCTNNETKADSQEILKNHSENTVFSDCDIVVDKETHVEYLVVDSTYPKGGISITPRLQSDGTPMVKK